MNSFPMLACGPGPEIAMLALFIGGSAAISILCGLLCLGLGQTTLGWVLTLTPLSLLGSILLLGLLGF